MRKAWVLFVLGAAVFACPRSEGFGSVAGGIVAYYGPTVPCGSEGTLYRNLTSHRMNFELDLDTNVNFSCSSTSLSWTDAKGQPQTLTVNKGFTKVVATSLPAGGTISWNTPSGATHVGFWWVLQRGQAMGASSNFAEYGQCGTSGSLYSNLTDRPLELDFSVSGPTTCEATFSWTDAAGHAQNLDAGRNTTEGVSTTLSAGGTISWTATAGGADAFTSFVEQVPVTGSAGD